MRGNYLPDNDVESKNNDVKKEPPCKYKYIGCFMDRQDLWEKTAPFRTVCLYEQKQHPHVTFEYMPQIVDESLFGKEIAMEMIGYGNNGLNEGVKICITEYPEEFDKMIRDIPLPHITLSISRDAKAVNTRYLSFSPIQPVRIIGEFGGCTFDGDIVLQQPS